MVDPGSTHICLVKTGAPLRPMAEGIGCNFLLTNQSTLPPVKAAAKWRQILRALDDLRVGWMRVGLIPTAEDSGWDDRRQAWNFRHPRLAMLEKIGRWATDRGVPLMFACLLLVNDVPGRNLNVGLELGAPFRGRKLCRRVCDETRKGVALAPIAVSRRGEAELMLTPSSLTVLSLRDLG